MPALSEQHYLKASSLTNTSNAVRVGGGFKKLDGSSTATRGWQCAAGANGTLEITLPGSAKQAYLFANFASGSQGTVTVVANNGEKHEISVSSATIPTLLALTKGQTHFKVTAAITAGSFTVYNIALDQS